jgi:hypothetical protein
MNKIEVLKMVNQICEAYGAKTKFTKVNFPIIITLPSIEVVHEFICELINLCGITPDEATGCQITISL